MEAIYLMEAGKGIQSGRHLPCGSEARQYIPQSKWWEVGESTANGYLPVGSVMESTYLPKRQAGVGSTGREAGKYRNKRSSNNYMELSA